MEACPQCENPVVDGEGACAVCGATLTGTSRREPERPPSLPAPPAIVGPPLAEPTTWPSRPVAMPTLEDETRCRSCHCRLLADQLTCPSCGDLLTLGPSTGARWVGPAVQDAPAPLGTFRALDTVAAPTRMALSVLAVAAGAALLADVAQLAFLNTFIASPDDQAMANRLARSEQWQSALDAVSLLVLVPALGLLILLTFRAYANLGGLDEHDQPWPASWVVLGWLIPLVNLVLPKLVLDHLWRTSAPLHGESVSDGAEQPPLALHVAWVATVAAAVLSFGAYLVGETDLFMPSGVVDPVVFRWQAYLAIPAGAALLTAALLGGSVVRELSDRQQVRRAELLDARADRSTMRDRSGGGDGSSSGRDIGGSGAGTPAVPLRAGPPPVGWAPVPEQSPGPHGT